MQNIVKVENSELVVSVEDIARFSENDVESVKRLLNSKKEDFSELNLKMPKGSYKDFKSLKLNEAQATLLIISLRSNRIVDNFRLGLVKQFYKMKEQRKVTNQKQLDLKDKQIKKLSSTVYAKRRAGNLQTVTRIIKDNDLAITPHDLNILLVSKGLLSVEDKVVEFFSSENMQNNSPLLHTDTVLNICREYGVEASATIYPQFDFGNNDE